MADLFEIPLNETTLSLEFAVLISGLVLAREKTLVMLIRCQIMEVGSNQILELFHQVALVSIIAEFLFEAQDYIIMFIFKFGVI